MLLPDNIHPEDSIYYNGAFVLQAVQQSPATDLLDVYQRAKQLKIMSMPVFVLCVDWLYLLDILTFDDKGSIKLCI